MNVTVLGMAARVEIEELPTPPPSIPTLGPYVKPPWYGFLQIRVLVPRTVACRNRICGAPFSDEPVHVTWWSETRFRGLT